MNDKQLAAELRKFLAKHQDDKNFYNRTEVGKLIEKFCRSRDNFKWARRKFSGKRGFEAMELAIAIQNGFDPNERENDDYRE